MKPPPVWTKDELSRERAAAEEHFRESRQDEPLEIYLEFFDKYQGVVEEVMEETVDLARLDAPALDILSDELKREVFRYLTGPPVAEDDLKVLMEAKSLGVAALKGDPALLARVIAYIRNCHDRRRFPWVNEPGGAASEQDRKAAVLATTAMLAMRRTEMFRRSSGSQQQEELVELEFIGCGFRKVKTRNVKTLSEAPKSGEFCRESKLAGRKADFILGLWDGRTLALECKVSNSSTNSVKRLNNDAAAKARKWTADLGSVPLVVGAVLTGVYKLHNLEAAQGQGLTIFWAHDLKAMTDWIATTRDAP